ncbi:RHS repeat-associated core domain-containing protein [Paenibacillus radicis (ex Gao et al. 2016)]|uniref:Uncharacterized protein n=1 Tax=Paenibacillus radicis (ex Gao et al. 2016) TaxID=1737354 RepID=A0A917HPJ1_9BACL|nr:RHS repeat-associated core domain-containing protein [Paenibacillus radicis (ex Gao et al. 2016)]GGG86328.1 hypothetical protein GCM10010918_50640 [Paenibacillus radicis (ex Gao et al. 2016)]
MKRIVSLMLIASMALSVFSDSNSVSVYASSNNNNSQSVNESVYLPEVLDDETTVTNSVYKWGRFSDDEVAYIREYYSIIMKKLAAFYYSELSPLLETNELLSMLEWDGSEISSIIATLTEKERESLRKQTPVVMNQYDFDNHREETLEKMNVQADPQIINVEGNEVIDNMLETYEETVTSATYGASTSKQFANSTGNPYRFEESNNSFHYSANTSSNVDPMYKTSNQREVDLYLPGRNGLDFSITRSYNSLNAKILLPTQDGNMSASPYCNPTNSWYKNYLPDCMGNTPTSYIYDIHKDPTFLAVGWSLNIPHMQKGTIQALTGSVLTSGNVNYYYRSYDNFYDYITFSLDDGTSYEFRGGSTPYNHPYSNVTYNFNNGTYNLVVDDKITYRFDESGKLVSKSNLWGDTITYSYSSDKIFITDSVGRTIELIKPTYSGYSGFIVKDKLGAKTHEIKYDVTYKYDAVTYVRAYDMSTIDTHKEDSEGRFSPYHQLNAIIDVVDNNKILKTYTYYTPDITRNADFNFEDDYYYTTSNGLPILDFNNGAEAKSIVDRDAATHGSIPYLLLNEVTDTTGLTTQFKYQTSNWAWYYEQNGLKREQTRGTIRLYMDPWNLSYVGYHQVTNVYYKYKANTGEQKLLTQYVSIYTSVAQEIWTTPKTGGVVENYRLKYSSNFRQPTVPSSIAFDYGGYREDITSEYRPINGGLFVTTYEYKYPGNLSNGVQYVEDGVYYGNSRQEMQAYQYDPNKNKPYLTKQFDLSDKTDEMRKFLWQGQDRNLPSQIAQYAALYRTEYDAYGAVIYQEDPYGNKVETTYGGPFHQVSVLKQTASDGLTKSETTYTYQADGTLSSSVQKGYYRDSNNPALVQEDQVVTEYSLYNANKQPTRVRTVSSGSQYGSQPLESIVDLRYDADNLHVIEEKTHVTLSKGQAAVPLIVSYNYDNRDRLSKQTFPDGSTATYQYDLNNRMISETYTPSPSNPGAARTKSYSYNDAQRLIVEEWPDGKKLYTNYTPYGDVETQTQSIGSQTRVNIKNITNSTGKLIYFSQPYGDPAKQIKYDYSSNGQIKQTTDPLGSTNYYYANMASKVDGSSSYLQNTTKVVSPDGKEMWTFQDKTGRTLKQVETNGVKTRTTRYAYTPLGALSQMQVSANGETQTTQYKYDSTGNLIYLKDHENNVNRYVYNRLGQVIATYTNDQLQKQSEYNQVGWQLLKTNAEGKQDKYQYTNTGLLDSYTDKMNQTHKYTYTPYDEVNRQSVLNASGTEVYWQQYSYNPITRLLAGVSNSEGENQGYNYDEWNRLNRQTVANRNYDIQYDNYDRMKSLKYPDGELVSYNYDVLDRILSVTSPNMGVVQYDYTISLNENTSKLTYPNGLVQTRKVNSFGELTSYGQNSTTNNTSNWSEIFSHDGFSNISNINRNGSNLTFHYDGLNRIKDESTPEGERTYSYDERGNRLTASGDLPGLDMEESAYTYNPLNMLKTYSSGDKQASYTYYGDGLRATKTVNGKLSRYVYLNGHIIEELDANGNTKARNVWGNELLYRHDYVANKKGYYSYNGHGDVIKITDGSGNAINTYNYDIWGNILSQTENMSNPFKYTGEVYDEESKLYYLRARYYDPSIGRFINEDTYEGEINNPLSLNLYTYVMNNPLLYSDPSGHKAKKGLDLTWASFLQRYGSIEIANILEARLDGDISVEEMFDSLGMSFTDWDDAIVDDDQVGTVSYQKGAGPNLDETRVATILSWTGQDVTHLAKKTGNDPATGKPYKNPDYKVDGVVTELKTLNGDKLNLTTGAGQLASGLKQAGTVILDARKYENVSEFEAFDMLFYGLVQAQRNKVPLYDYMEMQVWTRDGMYIWNIGDIGIGMEYF